MKKLGKLTKKNILNTRRAFDLYLAKNFPHVTGAWRENAWIIFVNIKEAYGN